MRVQEEPRAQAQVQEQVQSREGTPAQVQEDSRAQVRPQPACESVEDATPATSVAAMASSAEARVPAVSASATPAVPVSAPASVSAGSTSAASASMMAAPTSAASAPPVSAGVASQPGLSDAARTILENPASLQRMWQSANALLKKQKPPHGVLFLQTKPVYDEQRGLMVVEFPAECTFAFSTVQSAEIQQELVTCSLRRVGRRFRSSML